MAHLENIFKKATSLTTAVLFVLGIQSCDGFYSRLRTLFPSSLDSQQIALVAKCLQKKEVT